MSTQSESLAATINQNPQARGLAIIITNDYKSKDEVKGLKTNLHPNPGKVKGLKPLEGTYIDGESMNETFLELGYAVYWKHNINNQKFTELIYEASNLEYPKFKKFQYIVFVFAGHGDLGDIGHGDLGDIVYLQDGSEVKIGEGIIKPFLPKSSPQIGKLQKLFFFDACRGNEESKSVEVPVGSQSRGKCDDTLEFASRGGRSIERIKVPEEGGFLVAYSTMSRFKAWEEPNGAGGAWLQRLAKEIRINNSSIEDVLTKVNSDMLKYQPLKVQQPEKLSRLNEVVFLNPKKEEKAASRVKIAAVFPSQPTPSQPTPSLDRTEHSSTQAALSPTSSVISLSPVEDLQKYFGERGKVEYIPKTVRGGYKTTVIAPEIGYTEGKVCFSRDEAKESAAREALTLLSLND